MMELDSVKKAVRERYAEAARRAAAPQPADAATPSRLGSRGTDSPPQDPVTRDLYDELELSTLPREAVRASLGCGNPAGLAELSEGEIVLDLGSGGGIDVLLAARDIRYRRARSCS
jgi:arsenite methyltransferase